MGRLVQYRFTGKKMVLEEHAKYPPMSSSKTDYTVGRVLWALTDEIAAIHFAVMTPVPPIEWLAPLSEPQFGKEDLSRFGIKTDANDIDFQSFSIINRPCPSARSSWMCIANNGWHHGNWDSIMNHISRWMIRHLNEPTLLLWIVKQGGCINVNFKGWIHQAINHIKNLEEMNDLQKLEDIRKKSPQAIPDQPMRLIWQLLLSGRVRNQSRQFDIFDWVKRFKLLE